VPVPEDRRPTTFRLLVVPGVTVDRWSRAWSERVPGVELQLVPTEAGAAATLLPEQAEAGLLRLPVDPDTFHAIPLYTEATVVVIPRDHLLAAADQVTVAELADDALWRPVDDVLDPIPGTTVAPHRPATTAAAVELVAAGVGVLVVPQSLARAHQRKDLTYRVIADAPTSSVALVWARDRPSDLIEEMIGIVRGRTANSTRGRTQPPAAPSVRSASKGGPPRPAPGRTSPRRGTTPRRRGR
jgi:DNA-binding transcriptional LysR family regulator